MGQKSRMTAFYWLKGNVSSISLPQDPLLMSPLAQAEIKSIRNKSVNRPVLSALSSLKVTMTMINSCDFDRE